MGKDKSKGESKIMLSSKEIERIKKDLARVDALKKALGMKRADNPYDVSDFSALVYLKLGDISGKMWWILGSFAITTILLIIILGCVLGTGGGN